MGQLYTPKRNGDVGYHRIVHSDNHSITHNEEAISFHTERDTTILIWIALPQVSYRASYHSFHKERSTTALIASELPQVSNRASYHFSYQVGYQFS